MKKFLRGAVLLLLRRMAKSRLKKFKGKIIVVTGSVGKTSTKEAIFSVLNTKYKVQRSLKSMNSEFGVPLTVLEIESGFSSAPKWIWLLGKAFFHSIFKNHNEVLLLEFGVDKKGDMDFLTSIVKPDIAVITSIAPVHMDEGQFKDLQEIFDEKSKLAYKMREGGKVLLNMDNTFLAHLAKKLGKKKTVTFGRENNADYYASSIKQSLEGLSFTLNHDHQHSEITSKVLGKYNVYTLMPAIIIGQMMGMNLEEILHGINKYILPPGRLSLIPAVNDAMFLDSSYNCSPEALKEALKVLKEIGENKRKIAVIGNMNELGEQSQALHEMVGEVVPEYADVLVTVGAAAKFIADKALEKGMASENVHVLKNVLEAIEFFKGKIKEDDLILVKGSQNNVRLERLVKEYMADPEEAKKLLVRQEKEWSNI